MPVITPVKDCKVLIDVEIEPLIRREGPFAEIVMVRHCREKENSRATKNSFTEEDQVVGRGCSCTRYHAQDCWCKYVEPEL